MIEGQWTQETADALQRDVDDIFEYQGQNSDLGQLRFSFTIADPSIEGCPLIGCSTGFGELCGYDFDEIVGRNCRFLVEPVPPELVDASSRRLAREFCLAVTEGREYRVPCSERAPWMPEPRAHEDGIFLVQTNARKDGALFKNMFYLKPVGLNDKIYILGLQTALDPDMDEEIVTAAHEACTLLDRNVTKVEQMLASKFWVESAMRRQDIYESEGRVELVACD